ncbi:MAG: Holliday junction resolvase RuvX [Planctomycetaceae bacterium]|nr:Holliday junction resolvase RuvX [Planctomycetaceae bacterium]
MSQEFPESGALVGLDYGSKRVGIAISTPDQSIASALETLHRSKPAQDAKILCKICKEYRIQGLVVGLPVHMSGDEGEKAKEARTFAKWASESTNLPVTFWDERFTTTMAVNHLRESNVKPSKRKQHLDKLAAQFMLQAYLDSDNRESVPSAL